MSRNLPVACSSPDVCKAWGGTPRGCGSGLSGLPRSRASHQSEVKPCAGDGAPAQEPLRRAFVYLFVTMPRLLRGTPVASLGANPLIYQLQPTLVHTFILIEDQEINPSFAGVFVF